MNADQFVLPRGLRGYAPGTNPDVLSRFFKGLHKELGWFLRHPEANTFSRQLTRAERDRLGCTGPVELVGHRFPDGHVMWTTYETVPSPKPAK